MKHIIATVPASRPLFPFHSNHRSLFAAVVPQDERNLRYEAILWRSGSLESCINPVNFRKERNLEATVGRLFFYCSITQPILTDIAGEEKSQNRPKAGSDILHYYAKFG